MNKMKMTITIDWFDFDDTDDTIKEQLKEHGINRAMEMINQGYNSGELYCDINDTEYSGWWSYAE